MGYIDNIAILIVSDSTEQNNRTLQTMHGQAKAWALQHTPIFAEQKYEFIHFSRRKRTMYNEAPNMDHPLELPETVMQPSCTVKYLGIVLDLPSSGTHTGKR